MQAPAGRAFRLEARLTRVVATDYLVSVDTNRYAVPLTLTGQTVEVRGRDGHLEMRHRGLVATHPVFGGRQQLRILPEHGRGPIAPNARVRYSTGRGSTRCAPARRRGAGPGLLRGGLRPRPCGMTTPQFARRDEHLQRLRLNTVRERLEVLLQEASPQELSYADFLDRLLSEEVTAKTAKHIPIRTNLARFRSSRDSTASTSATSPRSTGSRSRS